MLRTYYVIRAGWNAANQSSVGRPRNPKNDFESGYYKLVSVVEAESIEHALDQLRDSVSVYNGQRLLAVYNVRSIKGLTQAARDFQTPAH